MDYELSLDAEDDLRQIAKYTCQKWGNKQLIKYRDGLKAVFQSIGNGSVHAKQLSHTFPQLKVTKYRYHYIFYLTEMVEVPVIIAVIHEKMDIVRHLKERLE